MRKSQFLECFTLPQFLDCNVFRTAQFLECFTLTRFLECLHCSILIFTDTFLNTIQDLSFGGTTHMKVFELLYFVHPIIISLL